MAQWIRDGVPQPCAQISQPCAASLTSTVLIIQKGVLHRPCRATSLEGKQCQSERERTGWGSLLSVLTSMWTHGMQTRVNTGVTVCTGGEGSWFIVWSETLLPLLFCFLFFLVPQQVECTDRAKTNRCLICWPLSTSSRALLQGKWCLFTFQLHLAGPRILWRVQNFSYLSHKTNG